MKKNFVAAKLASDDSPTAAENLKLLLILNADTKPEALYRPKRIVNVLKWVMTTMGLRSASALGFQEAATGLRCLPCLRGSVTLMRHQRSLPIMRLPSRSLASHTRHLVASGLVKLTGFGLSRWASICSLTKAPKSGVEGGLQDGTPMQKEPIHSENLSTPGGSKPSFKGVYS